MSRKTDPRGIASAERQNQALELRKAGATYELIAEKLGYASASGAFKAVHRGLDLLNEQATGNAHALRRLELERLDRLFAGIWVKAAAGDLPCLDRAIKIIERRARLLGLELPPSREHVLVSSVRVDREPPKTPEEAQATLERIIRGHY